MHLLVARAKKAATKSYAPYSHVNVGAAILLKDGSVFSGSNVENASYGLTNCAERSAIFVGLSAHGPDHFRVIAVAIAGKGTNEFAPCGACRQVLSEFADHTIVIYQHGRTLKRTSLKDLLPQSFNLRARVTADKS